MEHIDSDTIVIPVEGVLDLHTFSPKDVDSVVAEYLEACWEAGVFEVRIIHGKGKGVLRRKVQSILEKHSRVKDFGLDPGASGWGATLVRLDPAG